MIEILTEMLSTEWQKVPSAGHWWVLSEQIKITQCCSTVQMRERDKSLVQSVYWSDEAQPFADDIKRGKVEILLCKFYCQSPAYSAVEWMNIKFIAESKQSYLCCETDFELEF